MNKEQNKLDGVEFFLTEIENDIQEIIANNPTKQSMLSSMGVWLNHINTIKGIIQ